MIMMKKFAAAFAAAVLACGAVIPGVAFAAGSHTHGFSDEWANDTVNHWHPSTCGHDIIKDAQKHGFKDGTCEVCGYEYVEPETVHKHTYNTAEWDGDTVNHWHSPTCGHKIVKDIAPHEFADGVCAVCGRTQQGGTHVHTFADEWSFDDSAHWHAATCGHDVVKDRQEHALTGGSCICGYTVSTPAEGFLSFGAYNESLYATWEAQSVTGAKFYYRLSGTSDWTENDSELLRMSGGAARADVLGIKAGNYDIKAVAGGEEKTAFGIKVNAYDRSGYAHFNYAGVGAYKDDGAPKDGAVIVYVNEANKNTVKATVNGKERTGLVSILQNAGTSAPLIVRIVGTVGAATWQKGALDYGEGKKITPDTVVGINGVKLERKNWTQKELIDGGYNKLDTSVYGELIGLSSRIKYDSGKTEFDSCWNDCTVQNVKNVTVEGVGTDARIFQWGMTFKNCDSVEVRNITFEDYTEDACSFEGGDTGAEVLSDFTHGNIWIHHNVFEEGVNYWDVCNEQDKHDGDGSTDIKGLKNITLSYNVYNGTHKTGLIGGSDSQTTANVTFHHNAYNKCNSRMPLGRQANMHMYNNYYNGSTGTNMSLRGDAYAFIENCYFDNANNPIEIKSGTAKVIGCIFNGKQPANNSNLHLDAARDAKFENGNKFGKFFDTDPGLFYYDGVKTAVTSMLTAEETKTRVPWLAGVNK